MNLEVNTLHKAETLSTVGSSNSASFGEDDAPTTPQNGSTKLRSLFADDESCPSPPKGVNGEDVDMEISEVESRMRRLGIIPELLKLSLEKYNKLAYAIGKSLDLEIKKNYSWFNWLRLTLLLLHENNEIGLRFAALYRSDGDTTWELAALAKTTAYDEVVSKHLQQWSCTNENTYTVFDDEDHKNMQVFYRLQKSGNCCLQAPILLHWYHSLWCDPSKKTQDVDFIHLSKYVRNTFSASLLYEYIINNAGGSSLAAALVIMGEMAETLSFVTSIEDYATILSLLKKRGPALADVHQLHHDFQEPGKFAYRGLPAGTTSGHAMTLIGVRQDENNQVYYLLQNFWQDKPGVEVGQDYFLASGGMLIFMAENAEMAPISDKTYSEQTNLVRCAVSSPHLERANQEPRFR
jgi:hypothetical protein